MDTLLEKLKANLIIEHNLDDKLLSMYLTASISYAENFQHLEEGYYKTNAMSPTTEEAVIIIASQFYESRDGTNGGFFGDNSAYKDVWNTVHMLLRLNKRWEV